MLKRRSLTSEAKRSEVRRHHEAIMTLEMPEGFTRRLIDAHEWTENLALRVIHEYRRFLLLTLINEQAVPSKDVDAAWHEHLLHTRHYQNELCQAVLGRMLHHDPGSRAESGRYPKLYAATFFDYVSVFQENPPGDIWPKPMTEHASLLGRVGGLLGKLVSPPRRTSAARPFHPDPPRAPTVRQARRSRNNADTGSVPFTGISTSTADCSSSSDLSSGCDGASCSSGCGGGGD